MMSGPPKLLLADELLGARLAKLVRRGRSEVGGDDFHIRLAMSSHPTSATAFGQRNRHFTISSLSRDPGKSTKGGMSKYLESKTEADVSGRDVGPKISDGAPQFSLATFLSIAALPRFCSKSLPL